MPGWYSRWTSRSGTRMRRKKRRIGLRVARGGVLERGLWARCRRPRYRPGGPGPGTAMPLPPGRSPPPGAGPTASGGVRGRHARSRRRSHGRDGGSRTARRAGRSRDGREEPWPPDRPRARAPRRSRPGRASRRAPVLAVSCAADGGGAARQAEERDAGRLDEAGDRERRRQGQRRRSSPATANRASGASVTAARRAEQALERQPLAGEAVERRQAADRRGPDGEGQHRGRHPPAQAAEMVQVVAAPWRG